MITDHFFLFIVDLKDHNRASGEKFWVKVFGEGEMFHTNIPDNMFFMSVNPSKDRTSVCVRARAYMCEFVRICQFFKINFSLILNHPNVLIDFRLILKLSQVSGAREEDNVM